MRQLPNSRNLIAAAFAAIFALILNAAAQPNGVDLTFNAVPSNPLTAASSVVQPDGKLIIWAPSLVVDAAAKGQIARLNADGSLDSGFTFGGSAEFQVVNLLVQPDGKVIVGGSEGNLAKMVRLNANGSLDSGFVSGTPANPFGTSIFTVIAVQTDGKVLATRSQFSQGFNELTLFRFNADGAVDGSFTPVSYGAARFSHPSVTGIKFLSDGRFYLAETVVGSASTSGQVRRFNANGTVDPTWEVPTFATPVPSAVRISSIDLDAAGNLLVAGNFDTVNGFSKQDVVRLQPAGNVDLTFTGPSVIDASTVRILATGQILLLARIDITGISRLFRLNPDGSVDSTFNQSPAVETFLSDFSIDSQGRILFLARVSGVARFVRLSPSGDLDASYNPNVATFGRVVDLALRTDGKTYVLGDYTKMDGVSRPSLSRVNADGSLDAAFDPGSGFSSPPAAIAVQSDGRLIAVGNFTTFNGASAPKIARINNDGSLDASFAPAVSDVQAVSVQADGRILIGGGFSSVDGVTRTRAARLLQNGTLDPTFNPTIGGGSITQIFELPDGKILIGGSFTGVNGFNRGGLARLNPDGSLDQTFNASVGAVVKMRVQADGKVVVVNGNFILSRRNADGSADAGFTAPTFSASSSADTSVNAIHLLADGSILVGGRFDFAGTYARSNFVRLAPSGALDLLFMPKGTDGAVRTIVAQPDGKVIIGGDFRRVDTTVRPGIARITLSPFRNRTPFDFDGDGRADVSVYRASSGTWYQLPSGGGPIGSPVFGVPGDVPVPADYDGDGKTDVAIFRPSSGDWWYRASSSGALINFRWGAAGDVPRPTDFDGDGKTDFVVFRPSTRIWYRWGTLTGTLTPMEFGIAGDQPLIGDFDGDGKGDLAVFRPASAEWWYAASGSNGAFRVSTWGTNGDIPVPADFDGDGKTDIAIFRPSNGQWWVYNSANASIYATAFGISTDVPVAADYDGDGKADIAVFRPSTGVWYILQSSSGLTGVQWGVASDIPVPASFKP